MARKPRETQAIRTKIHTIQQRIQQTGIVQEIDEDRWGAMMQQRIAAGGLAALLAGTPEQTISAEYGDK